MRNTARARSFLAIAALLAGNGCFETQMAGTSTTTGNTISARVVLSDGSPAAGAKVSVRESGFIPPGVPGYRAAAFAKDTVADASGNFAVAVPAGPRYFLSVYAAGPESEVYWRDNLTATTPLAKRAGPNDTLRLQKTASLSGYVLANAGDSIWLGFPGASHFARPQGDGSFTLDSLSPGSHDLHIIRSGAGGAQILDVGGWTALSGASMILDTLFLPADTSIHALSLPACRDTVDSIVFDAAPGHSRPDRIFRSVMLSAPPEWVEMDACLGRWTRKAILPPLISGNFELFAGPAKDFLIFPDSNRILEADYTGSRYLAAFPESLALADAHAGRYYAFFHLDSAIQSFPDEASWLLKTPDRNFPRPAIFQRLAVNDSAIHFLNTDSAGLTLRRYNLTSGFFHPPVSVPGFSGTCAGMAAGAGDELWLLNSAGELHRVDGLTGTLLFKARVAAPDSLQGLAGGI